MSLAARGHSLTLATLCNSPDEQQSLARLQALGVQVIARPLARRQSLLNCIGALPTPLPLQAVYCRSQALRAEIEAALGTEGTGESTKGNREFTKHTNMLPIPLLAGVPSGIPDH